MSNRQLEIVLLLCCVAGVLIIQNGQWYVEFYDFGQYRHRIDSKLFFTSALYGLILGAFVAFIHSLFRD